MTVFFIIVLYILVLSTFWLAESKSKRTENESKSDPPWAQCVEVLSFIVSRLQTVSTSLGYQIGPKWTRLVPNRHKSEGIITMTY